MTIIEKDTYSIVEDDKNNVNGFSNYLENHAYNQIKGKNVIVNLLKYGELTLEELLGFLNLSNKHRQDKNSFVIVNDTINIDNIPDEMAIVPTLQEAVDYIQMEELERDFGLFE